MKYLKVGSFCIETVDYIDTLIMISKFRKRVVRLAVLKNKRKVSRLEFLHQAYQIRRKFTDLLLRDFGTRAKVRNSRLYTRINGFAPEDQERFLEILDKYQVSTIIDEYPEWLISNFRNIILHEVRMLVRDIIQANTIYPMSESEYYDRRRYQTAAIGCCEQIIQEMQYVIETVDVDANKYLPYVDMLEHEIALIKAWRKSDNRILKAIRKRDLEKTVEQEVLKEKLKEEMEASLHLEVEKKSKPKQSKKKSKTNKNRDEPKISRSKQPIKQDTDNLVQVAFHLKARSA